MPPPSQPSEPLPQGRPKVADGARSGVPPNEPGEHRANPIGQGQQRDRLGLGDEAEVGEQLDQAGNLAAFSACLAEALPLLACGEPVGSFPDERHGVAGGSK